jgi:outer membrane protein assembly factor BamA
LQPEDPDNPGYRDVLIEVEETVTGRFSVGAAVSSDAGVIGTIAITERNFDVGAFPGSIDELIAGEALGDDIRVEVELLRDELDMLKRAFRRHCVETA